MTQKFMCCLAFLLWVNGGLAVRGQVDKGNESDSLFDMQRVVSIRLQFSDEEWAKLQPGPDVNWNIEQAFSRLTQDAMEGGEFRADESKRPGLAGYLGIDHQYGRADVTLDGKTITEIGVRYKGNGTFWLGHESGKWSFKLDFEEFVDKQKYLGLKKINLNNCITDPSMLREALSYEMFRRVGIPASRTGWAEVEVQVGVDQPVKKMGLYLIVEQVDKRFLKRVYGSSQGLLVKPSYFGTFPYLGQDWAPYETAWVPKTDPQPLQEKQLIAFARLLHEADEEEFEQQIENYLDMEEFLSFLSVNVLLSNLDSFLGGSQNYYAYLEPDSNKLQLLPWDMDISFGAFSMVGTPATRRNLSINHPEIGQGSNRLIERVLAIPRFQEAYHAKLRNLVTNEFSEQNWLALIQQQSEFIRPYVAEQGRDALDRFDVAIGSVPNAETPNPLAFFVKQRTASVLEQLDGKSQGDRVNFNGPLPAGFWQTLLWILIGLLTGLLVNLAAWIWGIVAGARNHVGWCLANLFFYPFSPVVFGLCVDRQAGWRAALMTMFAVGVMIVVAVLGFNAVRGFE
ncbi:MAG: CotH kinase family protein [Mariniblastus sp.]|nr:CotH kinase family protein [Mariniblastus sp.]